MTKEFFSVEKVNCSRQAELDLLKAFPILFMVIIHVYENLSVGRVDPAPHTLLEHVLQFLSGPATAPAFMFAMGVGIIYARSSTPGNLVKRGLKLFLGGYVLNAARSGILTSLSTALTGRFDPELIKYCLLNMDIFHFAGLAMMLSALFFRIKVKPLVIAGISLIMQLIGRCLAELPAVTGGFCYVAGLFYKCTWFGCFPLLQWYVFPAFGILYGTILQHISDRRSWYRLLGLCAAALLLCYVGTLAVFGFDMAPFYSLADDAFYNQSFLSAVFSVLLISIILSVSHPIAMWMEGTSAADFVKQVYVHLNDIFVIQWLLIGNAFSICRTFDLPDLPLGCVIPTGVLATLITGLILRLYLKREPNSERIFLDFYSASVSSGPESGQNKLRSL